MQPYKNFFFNNCPSTRRSKSLLSFHDRSHHTQTRLNQLVTHQRTKATLDSNRRDLFSSYFQQQHPTPPVVPHHNTMLAP